MIKFNNRLKKFISATLGKCELNLLDWTLFNSSIVISNMASSASFLQSILHPLQSARYTTLPSIDYNRPIMAVLNSDSVETFQAYLTYALADSSSLSIETNHAHPTPSILSLVNWIHFTIKLNIIFATTCPFCENQNH